jgi:acyl-CoA hydrolase
MIEQNIKTISQSKSIKEIQVFPPDTNHLNTMFGGKITAYVDDIASISAKKHACCTVVTASMDSFHFLKPINLGDVAVFEAIVTWTRNSSMEVFVKVTSNNLENGEKKVCAIAFLTFVALDKDKKTKIVPNVIPESDEEIELHEGAPIRSKQRLENKENMKAFALKFDL